MRTNLIQGKMYSEDTVSVWDELLSESQDLEERASKIQDGEKIGLPKGDIDKLIHDYHVWFARCLPPLPEDLKAKFRAAYEGSWISFRIKKFLEAPTERNMFYASADEAGKKLLSPWTYPYAQCFYPYLFSQRQLLIEASERQEPGAAASTDSISYENIIRERVPGFVLPELTDDQRLYLQTIYDHFHVEGTWPTFLQVENTILQAHPEKRPDFDLAEICKGFPDDFISKFTSNNNYRDKAMFFVPVLAYFPEAKEEIESFLQAIGFCLEKMNTSTEEVPGILSEELSEQLHLDPLTVRKIGLLLPAEPWIPQSSGSNEAEGWWRMGLRRGKYGIRRFDGIKTFEQYLEKRTIRAFSDKAPVTPVAYEPAMDMSFPAINSLGAQYHIVQGDQYNISGNPGDVKVKSPSIAIASQGGSITTADAKSQQADNSQKSEYRSPWVSGSFYLAVFVVIMASIAVIGRVLPLYALPIAIIGGILLFSVIGAFQIRNDEKLSEENFLKLMTLSFKYLPWIKLPDVRLNKSNKSAPTKDSLLS